MNNQEVDLSMKRAFAAMGDSSTEESEDGGFKIESLLAIEQTDKYDFRALIAETDSKDDEEDGKQSKVSFLQIKVNIDSYSKRELESLLSTLIDAYQRMTNQEAGLLMKRAFATMGDSSEEKFEDGGFVIESLLAIEQQINMIFLHSLLKQILKMMKKMTNKAR
ncbi:hypothetical protein H5410_005547 [Solanum commersonii]|uniref:Uncharacterized protein n=1 Tax=Solanum commersonii TaxID=4109 RepID=A0A9J6A723_SOLCO|nr:hypothetical protein H5410_005547 [Solanum commersonii]